MVLPSMVQTKSEGVVVNNEKVLEREDIILHTVTSPHCCPVLFKVEVIVGLSFLQFHHQKAVSNTFRQSGEQSFKVYIMQELTG